MNNACPKILHLRGSDIFGSPERLIIGQIKYLLEFQSLCATYQKKIQPIHFWSSSTIIILVLLIPVSAAVTYLYFLAIIGVTKNKLYPREVSKIYDFLILVPAHNEEQNIFKTLQSLKELEPLGKVEICVVSDNCTDNTADIVRANNIKVVERFNENKRGKGYALHWAISQFDLSNFDAVVIVDADTIVAQNMLHAIAQSIYGFWFFFIQLIAIFKSGKLKWIRTDRESDN